MERYRVKPKDKINLMDWDPNDVGQYKGEKDGGQEKLEELNKELEEL